MLVIGENINATNKSIAEAIISRNEELLANMARSQAAAGADFIDVNAGIGQQSEEEQMQAMGWLVEVVQSATDKPLVIDSDNTKVLEAGLRKNKGDKVIINSTTAEHGRLETVGRLAADYQSWLIALAMGEEGIPETVEKRLEACEKIITYLTKLGIKAEQIYFDPLVLPIAVDAKQAQVTLKTIEEIKSHYPEAKTVIGLSNISYGLPMRKLVNHSFMLMAAYAGLDAVIVNPLDSKMMSLIKVANMLTGKDASCRSYMRAHRAGKIVD